MANNADAVRVGGATQIYMAPVGTVFPTTGTDISTVATWIDTGYVSTDGVEWEFAREVTEIEAMQSLDPIRIMTTKLPKSFKFGMMQSGQEQFALALGGGTWAAGVPVGEFIYTPPDASETMERAAIVEMIDGAVIYRWLVKRCQNKEGSTFKYVRDDAATMPVTMSILAAPDGSEPFTITTNDPAMAATVVATSTDAVDDTNGEPVEDADPETYTVDTAKPEQRTGRRS